VTERGGSFRCGARRVWVRGDAKHNWCVFGCSVLVPVSPYCTNEGSYNVVWLAKGGGVGVYSEGKVRGKDFYAMLFKNISS